MTSSEVKSQVHAAALRLFEANRPDSEIEAHITAMFSLESDLAQEWAASFAAEYIRRYPRELINRVVERYGGTHEGAATALGVSQASISRYLAGDRPRTTILYLARELLRS